MSPTIHINLLREFSDLPIRTISWSVDWVGIAVFCWFFNSSLFTICSSSCLGCLNILYRVWPVLRVVLCTEQGVSISITNLGNSLGYYYSYDGELDFSVKGLFSTGFELPFYWKASSPRWFYMRVNNYRSSLFSTIFSSMFWDLRLVVLEVVIGPLDRSPKTVLSVDCGGLSSENSRRSATSINRIMWFNIP